MDDPTGKARAELQARIQDAYISTVPHNKALGLSVDAYGRNELSLRLPYRKDLIGNPDTGVLHGGCITSLIDATCGGSVIIALTAPTRIATLDLRIDYLKHADPGQDVICRAVCYKITKHVAFVRATAHHGDERDAIASASGTFVLFRSDPNAPGGG